MGSWPDWTVWIIALFVIAVLAWFFWEVVHRIRDAVRFLARWPQEYRAMVDAEARAGGRYPLWFRAVRVLLIVAMLVFVGLILWRRFS